MFRNRAALEWNVGVRGRRINTLEVNEEQMRMSSGVSSGVTASAEGSGRMHGLAMPVHGAR